MAINDQKKKPDKKPDKKTPFMVMLILNIKIGRQDEGKLEN